MTRIDEAKATADDTLAELNQTNDFYERKNLMSTLRQKISSMKNSSETMKDSLQRFARWD